MLDERDLQAVREIATEVTTDVVVKLVPDIVAKVTTDIIDKRVPKIIDERVPKIIDERVPKIIDERVPGIVTTIANDLVKKAIHDSEVMLLDEMERYDRKNERKFAEIQKDLSELKELYRMIKNEQDTITILIRNLEDHEMRISRLEEQSTQKNEKIRRIKS
ncbi:MAG: hypothetical protein HFI17_01545 [Lachnospiraceae bacterium]|jgi:hypothetical protein|nr:hypothetical protein [Lachnospiraceae bacterium]MCI9599179.1 hypothetical protein [Lachnospiraceae bacterium]